MYKKVSVTAFATIIQASVACFLLAQAAAVAQTLDAKKDLQIKATGTHAMGNGICDQRAGEDADTCPADCEPLDECRGLLSPAEIPAPNVIDFDGSSPGAIGSSFQSAHGVSFGSSSATRAIVYGGEPSEARSAPNVAINDAVFPATSNSVPMTIELATPKSYVGMWIGNGESEAPTAVLTAYDGDQNVICQVQSDGVPEEHTLFTGLYDPAGRVAFVTLDYGATSLNESIDDLVIAP